MTRAARYGSDKTDHNATYQGGVPIKKWCCKAGSACRVCARFASFMRELIVQKTSLTALVRNQLKLARAASSGRSATTVYGGHEHILRQTIIALHGGRQLDEHSSPGEATLYVLAGRVLLESESASWAGWTGDLLIIPDGPHILKALEDSAVMLTVAKLI